MRPVSAAIGGVILALALAFALLGCNPGPSPVSADYPCGTRGRSCGNGSCCGVSEECGTGLGCPEGYCCPLQDDFYGRPRPQWEGR